MDRKKVASQKTGCAPSALGWVAGLAVLFAAASPSAFAAATDITISTAAAPAAPRVLGPGVIGWTPATDFLYRVPATGQAPLKFEAADLPAGLAIDASTGIITGKTPAADSYSFTVTVTNSAGSASRTLKLVAGSTLALTPPMGWNSYDSFGGDVTEAQTLAAAQAMQSTMAPYGWDTVVIDFRWYDADSGKPATARRDSNGRFLPAIEKFPSATGELGFKPLADKIHAMGLKFGVHLMRGIPRLTYNDDSPIADSTYTAKQAGDSTDKCAWDENMYGVKGDTDAGKAWYDSIFKQYAAWGLDFVKVDDMVGGSYHKSEANAIHSSIVKMGRPMVFSLSPGPMHTQDAADLNLNANMWRQVNDFWDNGSALSTMSNEFDATYSWSTTTGITPGHWPDADMLPLGTIGNRQCAFSHNQQVQVMTLWAIQPSPLIFGGMPTKLSTDTWTLPLLTNEEVLAVNQDELGARAKRLSQQGTSEVWVKDLSGNRKAVALLNRAASDATIAVTFAQLSMTGTLTVRDAWNRKDVTDATSGISVNVPHDSGLLYVISPPNAGGTGGTSGAGGSGAGGRGVDGGSAGGTSGTAGTSETAAGGSAGSKSGAGGSAAGGASSAASGGVSGRGGASSGGSSGGLSGSGGASTTAHAGGSNGAGGAAGSSAKAGGSSGCMVGPNGSGSAASWLVLVAALLAFALRYRRNSHGTSVEEVVSGHRQRRLRRGL